jgi:tetratricopeptide (TPR) repeat protein
MEEQARALGGLADANYMQRRYRSAREMFERCVEVSAAQGFHRIEAANLPMLGLVKLMELKFATAEQHIKRAIKIANQIGHQRAAMMAYYEIAEVYYETDQPALALEVGSESLAIARSLGARRFIAFGLMLQAQREAAAGNPQASATIREANEMARETPAFVLPWGLGLAAIMARSDEERAAALAEGEEVLLPAH